MSHCVEVMGLEVQASRPFAARERFPSSRGALGAVQLTLDELPAHAGTREEARLRLPYVSTLERDDGTLELFATRLPGGDVRLDYDDGTVVVVEARGHRIWSHWPADVGDEQAAVYLLGPVLGVVLRLRGVLCLHASAVEIGGQALALVGPSGAGKSSTAAAFAAQGHRVLCDDIVPIMDRQTCFEVVAASSRLRLWPDSADALLGAGHGLPRLAAAWDKRALDLPPAAPSATRSCPLAAIYLLGPRQALAATRIEAVRATPALVALLTDTFANNYLDAEGRAMEFDLVSRIVRDVPLRRVSPRADLSGLAALASAIRADFEAMAERQDCLAGAAP